MTLEAKIIKCMIEDCGSAFASGADASRLDNLLSQLISF